MNPYAASSSMTAGVPRHPSGVSLRFIPHQLQQQPYVSMPMGGLPTQPPMYMPMGAAYGGGAGHQTADYGSTMQSPYATKTVAVISAPPMPASSKTVKPTTQVLPQDVNLVKSKRTEPKASTSHSSKTKKPTRFLRTAGGHVWEDTSLSEWDPNDFRLFCGDLGNEVSEELLAKAFRKYPSFLQAKVVRDRRSNKTKGYGFISFRDPQDFIRALREMDGKYVGNRPIKLRKSTWKDRSLDVVRKKAKERQKLGLKL